MLGLSPNLPHQKFCRQIFGFACPLFGECWPEKQTRVGKVVWASKIFGNHLNYYQNFVHGKNIR
jgi:hypothetical protein